MVTLFVPYHPSLEAEVSKFMDAAVRVKLPTRTINGMEYPIQGGFYLTFRDDDPIIQEVQQFIDKHSSSMR